MFINVLIAVFISYVVTGIVITIAKSVYVLLVTRKVLSDLKAEGLEFDKGTAVYRTVTLGVLQGIPKNFLTWPIQVVVVITRTAQYKQSIYSTMYIPYKEVMMEDE